MDTPARFRMNRASLLAVFAFALCLTTLTAASPWFLLVLVVPLLITAWVLRTGFDVDGRAVWATYHPSAAIRFGPRGAPRAGLLEDLTAVAGALA